MTSASDLAAAHYAEREQLARAAAAAGLASWANVDRNAIGPSWAARIAPLLAVLQGAQMTAARSANDYVASALDAQGISAPSAGDVNPSAFAGVASDGRPLDSLLYAPAVSALTALSRGATLSRSMAAGSATLDMIMRTQVIDAGRTADGAAIAARPRIGFVRVVNPPACSRCVILAGKYYKWNTGFRRHPRCDCIHVPAQGEKAASDEGLITDPKDYFESLSRAEQDKVFTKAGAEAIRDGADINQIVNARRNAAGLTKASGRLTKEEQEIVRGGPRGQLRRTSVYGQDVFITDEGTTRRGLAGSRLGAWNADAVKRGSKYRRARSPRLMPESIYELAKDREDAIRLLRRFGYIV